jgi:hypothetical protein
MEQQHNQRKMEIEQRAQEQRMHIEATAAQLIMQVKIYTRNEWGRCENLHSKRVEKL